MDNSVESMAQAPLKRFNEWLSLEGIGIIKRLNMRVLIQVGAIQPGGHMRGGPFTSPCHSDRQIHVCSGSTLSFSKRERRGFRVDVIGEGKI